MLHLLTYCEYLKNFLMSIINGFFNLGQTEWTGRDLTPRPPQDFLSSGKNLY